MFLRHSLHSKLVQIGKPCVSRNHHVALLSMFAIGHHHLERELSCGGLSSPWSSVTGSKLVPCGLLWKLSFELLAGGLLGLWSPVTRSSLLGRTKSPGPDLVPRIGRSQNIEKGSSQSEHSPMFTRPWLAQSLPAWSISQREQREPQQTPAHYSTAPQATEDPESIDSNSFPKHTYSLFFRISCLCFVFLPLSNSHLPTFPYFVVKKFDSSFLVFFSILFPFPQPLPYYLCVAV